jgi:hypothetical protein
MEVRRVLLLAIMLLLGIPAGAFALTGANPADELAHMPIEASAYDPATHCSAKVRPGMVRLQSWLEENSRGVFWGSYRCEMWDKREASLHAENRAIDWHLDVAVAADRRAADDLIELLLATDSAGNEQALARRMGVEELIWDCEYWAAGMSQFQPYRVCYGKRGKLRRRTNVTVAHRDHIHIGMTKAGAAAKTSFWRSHTG